MTNEEKARLYDDYVREGDRLQRENSKIKSEYVTDIPKHMQDIIDKNNTRISILESNLRKLFV